MSWNVVNFREFSIPEDIKSKASTVEIKEGVKSIQDSNVFYRSALNPNDSSISVLLLHGMRFSSETWFDLKTIQHLAAMGFHTVAVDLPGYGQSPAANISDKCSFLMELIRQFNLSKPVIVSPSMSGTYALPFLLKHSGVLAGYIPVAPVGIEVLEQLPQSRDPNVKDMVYEPLRQFLHDPIPDMSSIKTPTLVVFGEKDRSRSSALLNLLPNSNAQEIPNGGHPAYLDNPELWHQLLYNFLNKLSAGK